MPIKAVERYHFSITSPQNNVRQEPSIPGLFDRPGQIRELKSVGIEIGLLSG